MRRRFGGWLFVGVAVAFSCGPLATDTARSDSPRPEPSPSTAATPLPTASTLPVFDPAKDLYTPPYQRMVYFRAPCPAEPCERQTPPMTDEGKRFATNNYYIGFDGTWSWMLLAGWRLADDIGAFRLARKDDFHELLLPVSAGAPTLTVVTEDAAQFVTSTGRRGVLDLHTLKVTLAN
jgi:hypothetical protein